MTQEKTTEEKLKDEIGIIEQKNVRYKCNFCGRLFRTCSACAKHIEGKSMTGKKYKTIFPQDIIVVGVSKLKDTSKSKEDK